MTGSRGGLTAVSGSRFWPDPRGGHFFGHGGQIWPRRNRCNDATFSILWPKGHFSINKVTIINSKL
nr:MAG TPA: hypothetical protein [Caudoviricetes sp.]